MRRVLFYTDTPLLGGAENQMLLLAKFLDSGKYSVTLACSSFKNLNVWCQKFMELGVNVIRLGVAGKHDPRHFLYLKKILKGFDLLHLHVWNPASCRWAFLAAGGIPIVVTEHDPFILSGFKGWLKNKLMKSVRAIIAISEASKKIIVEQNPILSGGLTVVHNGIDTEQWETDAKLESRNEYRRLHFGVLPNEKVILCVAELNKRKGQKYLIEAGKILAHAGASKEPLKNDEMQGDEELLTEPYFKYGEGGSDEGDDAVRIFQRFLNFKIVFVGDGPERKYYEKLATPLRNKISFLGRKKEIAKLMTAADIFVLPSEREAFGLVLLEAAGSDLPIIATNVGGIPEIIDDGKSGILVQPENPKALAEAIKNMLENPEMAKKLNAAAKLKLKSIFSAKTMAQKTAEVYDKALKL